MKSQVRHWLLVGAALGGFARPAFAQQTMSDALSFLMTNRSVATDDFAGDARAAAAARDAFVVLIRTELAALPISSPAGGFTYRLDPAIGANVRTTQSFGPFFTERSLTVGKRLIAFNVSFSDAAFSAIDGRNLGNGTLVATASQLRGDPAAFDVETLTLHIRTRTRRWPSMSV